MGQQIYQAGNLKSWEIIQGVLFKARGSDGMKMSTAESFVSSNGLKRSGKSAKMICPV